MGPITRSVTVFLGITVFGISGYALYLLFQKDEDDEYLDTFAQASKFKTLEVRVPKDLVRSLIGRNGKNIKDIQDHSNTRINFRDVDDSEVKICVIRGSTDACHIAENLIQEFINNQPVLESESIWVPFATVGMIIGRSGERICEIRGLSGAKITVNDDEKGLTAKRLTIKGTKEQISVAKSLIEDIVEKSTAKQQTIDASLAKREPRLPPRSPEHVKGVGSPKAERLSPILGQNDAPFEVYVSAMVDPSRFWVQIVGPKATELDCLVEEMTEYYGREESREGHSLEDVRKGDLVAATFRFDSKWYRAEVLNIIEEDNSVKQAELYYVDYGDTDKMPLSDLYELRTDFLRLHFQAIECFLARVDPVGDSWSEEAVDKFEEWTHVAQWKKLSAKMNGYSVREKTRAKREGYPVPGVDLYEIDELDIDVAEELVKSGLAVFKKEALLAENVREKTRAKREGSPVPGVDLYEIDEHDIDVAEELVKSGLAVFKKEALLAGGSRATSTSNLSVAST